MDNNYTGLMDLLELSVLFAAENLSERLTDIIVEHWLLVKNVLSIWLFAHDLNLRSLRDVAFAMCLDRLEELPVSLLLKLCQVHFVQLVGNVNARCRNNSFLRDLTEQWIQRNIDNGILPANMAILRSVQSMIAGSENQCNMGKRKYLHCVVGSKIGEKGVIRKACIFRWDGERLSTLIDETNRDCDILGMVKDLVGMQVVGRDFSIYFVGGEQGLGTGRFNTIIWRYCLILKKFYRFSSLLEPRRHMAVEFIDNNFMAVAGGVGRHRLKLSTMNILNIHTGVWIKAANIPEDFTEVISTCVVGSKLLLYKSALHAYDLKTDTWSTVWPTLVTESDTSTRKLNVAQFLMCYKNMLYICDSTSGSRTCLWMIDDIANPVARIVFEFSTLHQIHVANGAQLIGFAHDRETVTVEIGMIGDNNVYLYGLYTTRAQDLDMLRFEVRMGSFNVIDPESLYRQN
ncbi:uncharacterized protein LOC107265333 isoform X2 [Cephus cinctus]|nr:uncharacterized protein LOC107265333 isoform X2 [Cephus cinctus]